MPKASQNWHEGMANGFALLSRKGGRKCWWQSSGGEVVAKRQASQFGIVIIFSSLFTLYINNNQPWFIGTCYHQSPRELLPIHMYWSLADPIEDNGRGHTSTNTCFHERHSQQHFHSSCPVVVWIFRFYYTDERSTILLLRRQLPSLVNTSWIGKRPQWSHLCWTQNHNK